VKRSSMKRGKPLSRSSSIKRSAKPIARKKRITPRSKKRAKVYRDIRVPFVVRVLRERPRCEAGPMIAMVVRDWLCFRIATNVHEILPRGRGGSIADLADDEVVACCDRCGSALHTLPVESYALGLLNEGHEGPRPRAPIVEWRKALGIVLAGRRNDSTERSEGRA
jgi:hypothetical protein